MDYSTAITLDKTKPMSKVYPPEKGAHWEQGGFYFGLDGKLAEEMLDDPAKKRLEKVVNNKSAQKAMAQAKQKFMKDHDLTEDDLKEDGVDAVVAAAAPLPGEVDIAGWARGDQNYQFFQVRKAVSDKFNFDGHNKKAIVEFLIKEGVVGEDEAIAV